jgi:probable rRNA maturation factor
VSTVSLDIRTTLSAAPSLPYEKIARLALGNKYELSLVVCGDHLARKMNVRYRKKTYAPNVLSFPYSKCEGEIILNVRKAEREARAMGISLRSRLGLLFVHGCCHLNGYDHGATMERLERNILRKVGIN